ncbi:MAG: zinc ABC transporter ATP-binding protein ZnuC [Pseudomonadota bacterium]|nr:zinc ABC transporter ATP-binding protein ZnuC [Pseudomonadota bacterium]
MTNNRELLLECRGISLSLQGRLILDNVDLSVHRGEIVTLIGPNGAGKSTLVRVALGLMKADQGSVNLIAGTRIGYMPQRLTIDPVLPLTVQRFLTLARHYPKNKLIETLSETGAAHLLDSPMQTLSGGETQRVLLARAMIHNPDLLILDEPVQGVDVNGQEELYRLISNIRKHHHCGILMISHDLHMVMSATDQVLCLNRHVCCSGHPDTVRVDPNYVALFGRTPVLMPYSHHHDHSHDVHGDVVADKDEHKGCNHG